MSESFEGRKFPRFDLPVLVEIPLLSDLPMVPMDISVGGFMVVVEKYPEAHSEIDCILHMHGGVFQRCKGEVVWVRKNDEDFESWSIGVSIKLPEDERKRLDLLLKKLRSRSQPVT